MCPEGASTCIEIVLHKIRIQVSCSLGSTPLLYSNKIVDHHSMHVFCLCVLVGYWGWQDKITTVFCLFTPTRVNEPLIGPTHTQGIPRANQCSALSIFRQLPSNYLWHSSYDDMNDIHSHLMTLSFFWRKKREPCSKLWSQKQWGNKCHYWEQSRMDSRLLLLDEDTDDGDLVIENTCKMNLVSQSGEERTQLCSFGLVNDAAVGSDWLDWRWSRSHMWQNCSSQCQSWLSRTKSLVGCISLPTFLVTFSSIWEHVP